MTTRNRARTWLGPEHVQDFGSDTKLLVKLLDAGRGATLVAPFAAGALRFTGQGDLLAARPPRPGSRS